MGKQGPCYHCGVTSTPLWRNGPPEKPVLCNACGSRWRTKGTLTNYTPLHARADFIDYVDYKAPRVKTIAITTKEPKLPKRKHSDAIVKVEGESPHTDQNGWKFVEEATSNRSSSGSAISYSESCIYFGGVEGCELTGSAQSTVWESLVPSRKRTGVSRSKPSSVEKLTKDLYCILHEQQQSSYLSGSSEEDLLLESGTPMDSFEMGHGGVLIKHLTEARDEESEASSFPVGNKTKIVSEAYSDSTSLPVTNGRKAMNFSIVGTGTVKKLPGQGAQEITRRDKTSHEKLHVLRSSTSPLRFIDLRDVASFEQFTRHMTHEEQLQLMKYLPSTDTAKLPDSLKSMFDSDQFLEAISFFQQMLLEGVFDLSFPGIKTEECRILKKLALVNLTKSKWVEHSQQLKYCKQKKATAGKGDTEQSFLGCGILTPVKRSRDGETLNLAESKVTMKNPRREQKCGTLHLPSIKLSQQNSTDGSVKACYDTEEMDSEGSSFSPRSLFAFPPDRSSCMLDSLPFMQESSEQDLLFDVPSNACFPQAELMNYNLPRPKLLQSNSQSGLSNQGESIGSRPSSSLLTEQ